MGEAGEPTRDGAYYRKQLEGFHSAIWVDEKRLPNLSREIGKAYGFRLSVKSQISCYLRLFIIPAWRKTPRNI